MMKVLTRAWVVALCVATTASAQYREAPGSPPPPTADGKLMKKVRAGQPLYATLQTNHGNIVIQLFSKDAPNTVANFVGLATGEREWTDPVTRQKTKKPLYENVIFHRIIDGFMIQGGDPLGSGRGGPGYFFAYEDSGRTFDRPGVVAMANRAARSPTNGSQFFITVGPQTQLNGGYTIFGQVVGGMENVYKIAQVRTNPMDRPLQDVVLKKVTISEAPPAAATPATPKPVGTKQRAPADAPIKKLTP